MTFDHTYIDNHALQTLVLLHGTGGTKSDFLFLDKVLRRRYNLLGLQGNVMENGAARFFVRVSDGNFDQESIRAEAQKLRDFLSEWLTSHTQRAEDLLFLGYSNGANMTLALMLLFPELVQNAVLLHPMLPFEPKERDLSKQRVFMSHGEQDVWVSREEQRHLDETLQHAKAEVTSRYFPGGHDVSREELSEAVHFIESSFPARV